MIIIIEPEIITACWFADGDGDGGGLVLGGGLHFVKKEEENHDFN